MRNALVLLCVVSAGSAQALSCMSPSIPLLNMDEDPPKTEAEVLRAMSKSYAAFFANRGPEDILVFGKFTQIDPEPLLHEDHFEAMIGRNVHEPNMPYRIEYSYFDVFAFSGHKIEQGELIPFVLDGLDLKVSFGQEYGGLVDLLPGEGTDLIGVLQRLRWGDELNYEVLASACPVYHSIDATVLEDLLSCYREGVCQ